MKKRLLLLLFLVGCGWVDPNALAPSVLSTTPTNGQGNIATESNIVANFNMEMDSSTITTSTFTIDGVSGSVSLDTTNMIATFTPSGSLDTSTNYTATITTGAQSTDGVGLANNYVWNFQTSDVSGPQVTSTNPTSNQQSVVLQGVQVSATFSVEMDPTSISSTTFFMKTGGVTVAGNFNMINGNTTAVFVPTSPLTSNTVYVVTITQGAESAKGNFLASQYQWTFRTGSS